LAAKEAIMATEQDLQALSPADRERLERLAELGGQMPLDMLHYVQRDGFEECEECIQAFLAAEQDIAEGRLIPHEQVMEETRRFVEFHAKQTTPAK
jgi:predicted transcriptional regulator